MYRSLSFIRFFFSILSIIFITSYMGSLSVGNIKVNVIIGIGIGVLFSLGLCFFDIIFRKFSLRSFNVVILGLFIGYLMGEALVMIFRAILDISAVSVHLKPQMIELINIGFFLFGTYLGVIMVLKSSDELYISIPFVRFTEISHKKKDIIVDMSALADPRLIDLTSSGIFDCHLIIPKFVLKELHMQNESTDEEIKAKSKKALEILKRIKEFEFLELRYNDTDFPEIEEQNSKILRLAKLLDSNVLSSEMGKLHLASLENIKIININDLSNSLKPTMTTGEHIKIKVQRYGKEPRQGVGYLEDGTMVVVNGGGDFIGETIDANVLSIKHTSSGKIIFCNIIETTNAEIQHNED